MGTGRDHSDRQSDTVDGHDLSTAGYRQSDRQPGRQTGRQHDEQEDTSQSDREEVVRAEPGRREELSGITTRHLPHLQLSTPPELASHRLRDTSAFSRVDHSGQRSEQHLACRTIRRV